MRVRVWLDVGVRMRMRMAVGGVVWLARGAAQLHDGSRLLLLRVLWMIVVVSVHGVCSCGLCVALLTLYIYI